MNLLTFFSPIGRDELPAAEKNLLDQRDGLTSALARHYGGAISLQVMDAREAGPWYGREIGLRSVFNDSPVAAGFLFVRMDLFSPVQQDRLVEGTVPFGSLMREFGIPFVSEPSGFVAVTGDGIRMTPLRDHVRRDEICYGRVTEIFSGSGQSLAHAVEILLPLVK